LQPPEPPPEEGGDGGGATNLKPSQLDFSSVVVFTSLRTHVLTFFSSLPQAEPKFPLLQ
jgi:hypothetical protein